MDPNLLEVYRERITREVVSTWNSFDRRGRTNRLRHIEQVLPVLARLDKCSDSISLTEWLSRYTGAFPPVGFSRSVDTITTEVIDLFFRSTGKRASARPRHVVQAIKHVAGVGDNHRRMPLISYFDSRRKLPGDQDKKATASALAAVVEHVPNPAGYLPLLIRGAEEEHRVVRIHSLLALAQIADALKDSPQTIQKLVAEMDRVWDLHVDRNDLLRQYPVSEVEYPAICEEMLGSSINDFVWVASAVVLGRTGSKANIRAVVAELEKGLLSNLFIAQRVAAETLVRIGAADSIINCLLNEARSDRVNSAALKKLAAIGAVQPDNERALDAILSAARHPDVYTRAAAIECLAPYSQAPKAIRTQCADCLEAIEKHPNWLLHQIVADTLETFRRQVSREEYVTAFKTYGSSSMRLRLNEVADSKASHGNMSDCVIDVLREDIGDESSAYLHYANAPSSAHAIELPAGRSPVDILYIEPMRDDSGRTIERLSSSGASKIMRALSMSRAFRQVSKHQEVICSDESIVLLSFNGVEPLVGCAIDLSRSIGFGVRMALHRHDNLRLTRNDMFSWTLAGDGISEATAIAGFGKPGQILLSESSVMVLPDAYKTFTRMFGRFDLTKRAIVVSVLYSSQHKFGFIDLNHVPANAKPTHFAVNQQEVRHPADRAVTLITILALFGLIGTGCWLCYNNSPILGWRFRDVGSAAAVTPTVRPNSTGNGPAQIETEQAEKPASALEPPVSPPDSSGDGPGDMKSPVLEPEKPQQTAALKALVINRVRSRPDGENNAPWSPWQPSRIDWSGKLTDADATEVYEIEVTVSYGNELSLKAFDRADEEMTTTKTSAPDVGGVQVWTVRGYGSYIKLRFTPRVDISPGLSETAQAPEDAFVRAYHCPKLAKVPSDAKIAP